MNNNTAMSIELTIKIKEVKSKLDLKDDLVKRELNKTRDEITKLLLQNQHFMFVYI